jgi:DnaJ family protein C protein 2
MSPIITKVADSLDWPSENILLTLTVQCAGRGFLAYQAIAAAAHDPFANLTDDEEETAEEETAEEAALPHFNLFDLSEPQLEALNYYQVLHLPYKGNLTGDDIKKAYRKASLKYHPDKSGRGDKDPVFLKVKTAYETLATQKIAYDSTEIPFDETLPDENCEDFFKEYGVVFELNLHFDARVLAASNNDKSSSSSGGNNKKSKRKSKGSNSNLLNAGPPSLGDETTSIEEVHRFYDYWTHFSSWRDFSIQAAQELETQDHLEQAESRFEKRWYQKEIDKKAKKLKQQEQARITTLVERSMTADPRLKEERRRQVQEKERRQQQKGQDALDKKQKEQQAKEDEERRQADDKVLKAQEKVEREKEKKLLRKVKIVFRKHVGEALIATQKPEHEMEEDVDLICTDLDRDALTALNNAIDGKSASDVIDAVAKRAERIRNKTDEVEENGTLNGTTTTATATVEAPVANTKQKKPFTKDELVTLAKGVKKFPGGGAGRWDLIANYVNNVCRPDDPRTKEECIETHNYVRKHRATNDSNNASTAAPVAVATSNDSVTLVTDDDTTSGEWTDEQDKQLQESLVKFPATMDKNERWTSITKNVPGKTKKECVDRFKGIRDAINSKK